MILCDYAVVTEGKLTVVGGAWTFTGPNPAPSALGVVIEVPWDMTNEQLALSVNLLDADGQPAQNNGEAVQFSGIIEVGRPPGHPMGAPLNVPFAAIIPPIQLTPGQRYEWVLSINGHSEPDWRLSFNVRPISVPQSA